MRPQRTVFGDMLHVAVAALLSLQLALPALSYDADTYARRNCKPGVACAPHQAALAASADAVAASSPTGLLLGGCVQTLRGNRAGTSTRAGVDVLFFARVELCLARAGVCRQEHRAVVRSLQLAAQGFLSAPSRAPPLS